MKKSKILMPLTGIAAIGAFAPVIAMSACHKNEYKIFDVSTLKYGQKINEFGDYTNIIGYDLLDATIATGGNKLYLPIAGKLAQTFVDGHHVYRSWKKAGSDNTKELGGTLIYLDEQETQQAVDCSGEKGKVEFEGTIKFADKLHVNTKMIDAFKSGTENVTFSFVITYEEFDKEKTETDAKSLGKQDVEYKLVLSPKHSLPTFTVAASLEGDYTKSAPTTGNFKGYSFTGVTEDLKVVLKDTTQDLPIYVDGSTTQYVTLKKDAFCYVTSAGTVKLPCTITGIAVATDNFTVKTDNTNYEFRLVVTPKDSTSNKYVLPSWEVGSKITAKTDIVFTGA